METVLWGLLFGLGVAIVGISLGHVALGPSVIPGAVPVNATMDSEDRFYAVFFLAYGAALLWCVQDWQARRREIQLLMAIFFAGGVARLISVAAVGLPNPFFVAMTAVELLLPLAVVWLLRAIRKEG